MPYTPQEWNNDDPTTPLSAARLTHIEEGIADATDAAEAAPAWGDLTGIPAALTSPPAAGTPGIRALGTGATQAAAGNHTHTIANVANLQDALDGKQAAGSYAAASHTHDIADVTSLQDALDGKQAAGSYAAASHTHAFSALTGSVDGATGATLQAILEDLAARLTALEP